MNYKKATRRTIQVILATLCILAVGAYITVHTKAFQRFVLAKIIQATEARTGAPVEIQRIQFHWSGLGVDFYGVTVYGRGGASQTPLFQSARLGVGLKIVSLFRRKVDLAELVLDRPVVHLVVNEQGETNLPKSQANAKSSAPANTLFDLEVRRMAINNGEIYYNDRAIPLSGDLADFNMHAGFDTRSSEYVGSLGYGRGRISVEQFNPIPHSLQAQIAAGRNALNFSSININTEKSRITASGALTDYANPSIQGKFETNISIPEMAHILKVSWLPDGQLESAGTLSYENKAGQSFLDQVRVDGNIRSTQLVLRDGGVSAEVKSVRGVYALAEGKVLITNLQADVLGGKLNMNSGVVSLTQQSPSRLSATLRGISLKDVSDALHIGNIEHFPVVGRADLDADISWSKQIRDLVVQSHLKLYSGQGVHPEETAIPLNGVVDVRYDGAKDAASFGNSHLQVGNTELSLNGTLSKQSNLNIRLNAGDLHEFSVLAGEIGKAARSGNGPASAPFDIHGNAQLTGRVFGSPEDPILQGRLSGSNLEVEGTQWRSIETNVDLSSSDISIKNATLMESSKGLIRFNANAGLQHWTLVPASPLSAEVTATGLTATDLQHLARLNYPVTGVVSANFTVRGTKQDPSGSGTLEIAKASVWNQPVERAVLNFEGSANSIHSKVNVTAAAGALTADLTYDPRNNQYEVTANASGVMLDKIEELRARNLGIEGTLAASASGRGTLSNPELSATVNIAGLQVRNQPLSSGQANLNITRHHANFTASAKVNQGNIQAKGDVELTGEYNTTATLDVRSLSIGSVLANYVAGIQPDLNGEADLHGEFKGPLKDPLRMESRIEVSKLNVSYKGTGIALVHPLLIEYHKGLATLEKTELKGTGSDFTLQGVIPVEKSGTMNIAVKGSLDAALIQAITRGVTASGKVEVEVAVRGELSHPAMQGNIRLANLAFSSESMPVGLDRVNGQIRITGQRFEIVKLAGTIGGGEMSAQGFMIYGAQPSFNLAVQANSVRVRYPEGIRTLLNCNIRLDGSTGGSLLSGRVLIDRLSFTQQYDLSSLAAQFSNESASTSSSAFEKNMKLNVTIQSAETVRLATSQLSIQGAANLRLAGTLADPVVLGRVTLAGGEIFFASRRYEIQSGTIEFSNPVRTNPTISIYANTTVEQYNITINFVGPVDRLRTNFTSDPSLPPADIINLIAFGQTSEEAAANPATPAALGAESILAKGVTGQLSGKIQRLAGISQLTINPLIGNSQQNSGAQISIQQRVTGNLLLTITADTTQTQNTSVQVQYRVNHSLSVSGLRDQNGGYAIDVHLHKSF